MTQNSNRGGQLAMVALAAMLAFALWSYATGGIVSLLFDPKLDPENRLTLIRSYFEAWGIAAPLAYVGLVVLETVVAPIPGVLLYLPGGAIFGWFLGGLAALAGNIIGVTVASAVSRVMSGPRLRSLLDGPSLKKYQDLLERHGFWVILLLRLNPLTSSDLVSYAAGLTKIPLWKIITATSLGMAPLCFLQAYFSEKLFTIFPVLFYPMTLVAVLYVAYILKLSRSVRAKGGHMPKKIVKSEDEWKKELTPEQFSICRMKGTERPFTGEYYKTKAEGMYTCSCCGAELFDSQTKYESGSGWPSFWQPSNPENIEAQEDSSHGMRRTEVLCSACGAHLGHLFEDGPKPTGLRYCINSASLKLKPKH